MMMRAILLASAVVALAACGDREQTLGKVKQDATPYSGTGKPYTDPGWKQGDKASWEQHLRTRAQNGQNDYTRTP